jgi:hypothetical protein
MHDTVAALEAQVGPYSKFHLFLYQRMASLHMLLSELDGVEHMFKKSIEVAEQTKTMLSSKVDQTSSVFMWQNNLLKFYMEHDLSKAIPYAAELIDEQGSILSAQDRSDLRFSLATSHALEGSMPNLDIAVDLFKGSLTESEETNKGYIYNNLGMSHFHRFVMLSQQIGDPTQAGLDAVKPVIENFEESLH